MDAREFFKTQMQITAVTHSILALPLEEFLDSRAEAESAVATMDNPAIQAKARTLLTLTMELARRVRAVQQEIGPLYTQYAASTEPTK